MSYLGKITQNINKINSLFTLDNQIIATTKATGFKSLQL